LKGISRTRFVDRDCAYIVDDAYVCVVRSARWTYTSDVHSRLASTTPSPQHMSAPPEKKRKQSEAIAATPAPSPAVPSPAVPSPEGVGDLDRYSIEWSMRTDGAEFNLGVASTKLTGRLVFSGDGDGDGDDETVETQVGSIAATQYRMHHMGNTGVNKLRVFDETQEGLELYEEVVKGWDDGCVEEMQGDLQVINRMVVDPAHRGHGLGLFMIEAADIVVNGYMSAQILKPYPLQFEGHIRYGSSSSYGFPEPPGKNEMSPHSTREAAFANAQAKIRAYYTKLGFEIHDSTEYMLRWNGCQHPSLDKAMRK